MPGKLPEILSNFKCWVFDCDGVLLDSNRVKTEAFGTAVQDYGQDPADALVSYHIENGGISRFKKFDYFFATILGRPPKQGELDTVLERFSDATIQGLRTCADAEGLRDLLNAIPPDVPRIVVSGGAQSELRAIFEERGLAQYFTAIYGSPDTKEVILNRERDNGIVSDPAIFIGDSRYDYEAATHCGLKFIFLHEWTEFTDWRDYFSAKDSRVEKNIQALINQ
jgi:phosphoglycolate phosphatase-like HAD superfamily hydrolase